MTNPIRVLLIEDSVDDALLIERELTKAGYTPKSRRVDSLDDVAAALQERNWDVVITDHNLPNFDSRATIEMVNELEIDLPIIIVSGVIGEHIAVEAMKAGAHDYIMKDNLARLVPAIERERREARMRRSNRQAQETILHLAYHDSLTGLVNRHEFENRAEKLIRSTNQGASHALLYIDLDQFKIVNDTCGHLAGDELLKQLSVLLSEPIHDIDTLARLGGDEFGALIEDCSLEAANIIANKLLAIIQHFHFSWQGKTFNLGASIGLVMINEPTTITELLRTADMACYTAKSRGRNRIYAYQKNDTELMHLRGEMEWVTRLNQALNSNHFTLYHQSIVSLHNPSSDEVLGEFLLRMGDDDTDLVVPGAFIPAAERYNLMPTLDRWVMLHVCRILGVHAAKVGQKNIGINFINLSGSTLSDEGFFDYVCEHLELNNLAPESICFEITETAAITHFPAALAFFERVRNLGARVALDDFGAGLSSFSYLKNIPADYLKIDGSFIRNMVEDRMDRSIVEAVNNLGHVAGLKTIAELVETEEIKQALLEIGVDYAQGYVIEKPSAYHY